MNRATITWLGHASVRVESGGQIFYFDPWLDANPACTLKLDEVTKADVVCVTHGHGDHLGDSVPIAKRTGARLVTLPEIAHYLEAKGLEYDSDTHPLHIGGSWRTDAWTLTMVDARHASDILGEEFQRDHAKIMPGSGCCGFVLALNDGPCIYYSGDTGVFGDMAIIRELYGPDVAILSAGGKYNMGARETAYAAGLLQPERLLPIHHGTFPDQMLDADELARELAVRAPKVEWVRLAPGESLECGGRRA
ncbi:MAG: metal-dependent hydrolase [Kiritimatiellae bacterium]|nr:metal-dependent hydrolase [Kiritimatiellia bacterium]